MVINCLVEGKDVSTHAYEPRLHSFRAAIDHHVSNDLLSMECLFLSFKDLINVLSLNFITPKLCL